MPLRVAFLALWLACRVALADAPHPAHAAVLDAEQQIRIEPEHSRRAAEQALALLVERPDADLEIRARAILCDYLAERDADAARRQIDAARARLPQAQRPSLAAALLSCEGELNELGGDHLHAMALFEQAVEVAERHADDERLVNALAQRGYLRAVQGLYTQGLVDLKRALALAEGRGLPHHARTALNGIAILYNRMGDAAQAKHFHERSLKAQLEAGLHREAVVTLHNIGRADERLERWDDATAAFARALALAKEIDYPRGQAYALRGLASVANARGDGARALQLLDEASAAQRASPDARLHGQIQLQRGIALTSLRRAGEALKPLGEALGVFVGAESLTELSSTHRALADAHAQLGDWQAAYRHAVSLHRQADTLAQRQLDQRFATLKVEFDAAAKDQENALLLRANASAERLLAEERRAGRLQAAVIALAAVLALSLGWQLLRQHRTGRQLHRLAHTDELTGLPNRRDALARLDSALPGGCALLIADLDHFKRINDRHGHAAGDEVLRRVAQALRECLREPASLGRLGGEEFVVVLPGSDAAAAVQVAERLRACVRAVDASAVAPELTLSVSIGVTAALPGEAAGTLLQRADAALYDAKDAGRDCVRVRNA